MSKAEEILQDVIDTMEDSQLIQSYDEEYNILSILGKETDEVVMCKVLWAILNWKIDGKKIVLNSFVKDVLKLDVSQEQLEKAFVFREYLIPNNRRRIDLVIKMPGLFIPIETKIYAKDQNNQCIDYLTYSKERCKENEKTILYYLTLDKRKPASNSVSNENPSIDNVISITWNDVYNCLRVFQLKDDAISQYCKALKNIVINSEKEKESMRIDDLIDTPEGMKAASEIGKSFNKKKNELMSKLFEEIVKAITEDDKLVYNKDINENSDFNYKERVEKYYRYQKSSLPGIMLKSKKIATLENGTEYFLVIRYEIDYRSYMFLGIAKGLNDGLLVEENNPTKELMEKVKESVNIPEEVNYSKNWILFWEYITTESSEIRTTEPNFEDLNDAYMALYDEKIRESYVKKVIEMFKRYQEFIK